MTLDLTYNVSGYISDSSGNAVEGATVYGYSMIEKGDRVSATTVTDGSYTFDISSICSIGDEILIHTTLPTGYKDGRSFTLFDDDTVNTFSLTDVTDYGGINYKMWHSGTYLYSAGGDNGVEVYTFSANTLTRVSDDSSVGTVYDITSDGTYIYAACRDNGIAAYLISGENVSYVTDRDDGGTYSGISFDGTYIYTACYDNGIRAYSFDGSYFTLIDTKDDGNSYQDVYCLNNYIYVACRFDGLKIYEFDGTSFVLKAERDDGGSYYGVYCDENYIYCACYQDGLRIYSFDGSNITLKASRDDGGNYMHVGGDASFIYVACSDDGLRAYSFDGTTITLHDTQIDFLYTNRVLSYDKVVYAGCLASGIAAYDFSSSRTMNLTVDEYLTINFTSENYESRLRYCPIGSPDSSINKNIDVLNFWTDEIEAVDRDINNEPLQLTGTEYASTPSEVPYLAYKFETIWDIMENDEEITIDDIDDCYNGVYVIKDFSIDSIPKSANAWIWNMSLEKVRDV